MGMRPATSEEERMVTSYHEAGHLTTITLCEYFGLRDPSVEINLTGKFSALSGAKKSRHPSTPETAKESVREYVKIALSGRAAEAEFSRRTALSGKRILPKPAGADHDIEKARTTLKAEGMEGEFELLWNEACDLVKTHWRMVAEIAELICRSKTNTISREQINALPSVRDASKYR